MIVGQVFNLRRVFNPPCTGPRKLLRRSTDPGADRVHLNIIRNPLELPRVTHPPVVGLVLPEGLSADVQHLISPSRRKSLERLHQLRDRHARGNEQMDVIGHYNEGVKNIVPFVLQMTYGMDHHLGELRPPQVQRTRTGGVEKAVHDHEGFTAGSDARECAILWKAAVQAPRQEDGMVDGMKVREPAGVDLGHEEEVRTGSSFSHGSAGRLEIGRRLKTCPTETKGKNRAVGVLNG